MMPDKHDVARFKELLRERIALDEKIQDALDKLLPPTTTGYRHRDENWSVWGTYADDSGLHVTLVPPKGAYPFHNASLDTLRTVTKALGTESVVMLRGKRALYSVDWRAPDGA